MLDEHGADYVYREYTREPLSLEELRDVFAKLGLRPGQMFRKNDAANKELGLSGKEDDEVLLAHMAAHPTLLQRPIGVLGERAVSGRPVENLLELLAG